MNSPFQHLQAVVLDWAGTAIDYGSRAPASVFQEIFHQRGINISAGEARGPMGMAKRDHIAAIAALPQVESAWVEKYGRTCSEDDIDSMYQDFLPLQKETLASHCELIPGIAKLFEDLKESQLKIGSSTGYTRELMEVVVPAARAQGYAPECVLGAEDAPRGRPAPYLLFTAAMQLDVFPMWRIVKVDDTPVGIQAGRNAGCWTVGITRTGNGVGLSEKELESLSESDQTERIESAGQQLSEAGADYLLESAADLMPLLREIDARIDAGERPSLA